jgi:glycosyltransferase involved in cell wall biosynthesis
VSFIRSGEAVAHEIHGARFVSYVRPDTGSRGLAAGRGAVPAGFRGCRAGESLGRAFAQGAARAVWVQGWQVLGYWQAAWAAKAAGAELWLRAESNDLAPVPPWKRGVKRAILSRLFARIDRFLYIGSANRRLYEAYGVEEARLLAARYAVDNARFARQAAALRGERAQLRRAWGIEGESFCVLFCGKFIAKKRPMDLLEAGRILSEQSGASDIHLLFVGAGELETALRAACDATGRERPRATFAGFLNQTEISRAYVAADCLVLPSDHGETWGLVVNEAMASGLPCIVSDACGCAEDLVPPEWVFPLGDATALAERLAALRVQPPASPAGDLPTVGDTVSAVVEAYAQCRRGCSLNGGRHGDGHA